MFLTASFSFNLCSSVFGFTVYKKDENTLISESWQTWGLKVTATVHCHYSALTASVISSLFSHLLAEFPTKAQWLIAINVNGTNVEMLATRQLVFKSLEQSAAIAAIQLSSLWRILHVLANTGLPIQAIILYAQR